MKYTAKVFKAEDFGYSVEFPDVPGVYTCGDTVEQCIGYAKEALELMLESVLEDEMVLPEYKTKANESEGLYSIDVDSRLAVAIEIHEAKKGLKSSAVAKKMEMSPQSFARLMKPSSNVSVAMLDRYARAVGKKLEIKFV